jgi:FtsP/CotA-like multicopper oxidase with cupredoxin domain
MYGWGYNGSVPGPTIEINEGDRVRIILHNKLPEPTTIHWHGLEVPLNMDGAPFISQPPVGFASETASAPKSKMTEW